MSEVPPTFDEIWDSVKKTVSELKQEISTVVVGQQEVVEQLLIVLLCRGHCLIEGVPGLAKTLLVHTLGNILGLKFHRIQFTPDLMPMDITGSEILQEQADGGRKFEFAEGPIFANLILADEINRTPPKTQAALLEAMQEKQVTVAGRTMKLDNPFIVYATQNPIEHEGTYPLPEAQLDRFMFLVRISYPSMAEEREVVLRTTAGTAPEPKTITDSKAVLDLQYAVDQIPLPDHVLDSILKLVHSTRPDSENSPEFVKKYVEWGAGPRASQNIARAAKALALLRGNPVASIDEVKAVARPVLRHRVVPNYNATGDDITVGQILDEVLKAL